MEDRRALNPSVAPHSAIWEPFTQPRTGMRKLGVPPGGSWNPLFTSLLDQIERPWIAGTVTALGAASGAVLTSHVQTAWVVFGSPGRLVTDQGECDLPCFWAGRGEAHLVSDSGGRINIAAWPSLAPNLLGILHDLEENGEQPIRCLALPGMGQILESCSWEVSPKSSRIGLRLVGKAPAMRALDASRPSAPGVIQAAGEGELLVHGPDGPTTGGYPQLGSVIRADRGRLSEAPIGAAVRLQTVSVEEAKEAWRQETSRISKAAKTIQELKRLGLV